MFDPEITCVVTCHDEQAGWVKRAIASVLRQMSPPSFELIVTVDKAAAHTLEAAKEAIRGHDNARVEEVFFGDLGESRNFGTQQARGRYCAFLDGDDAWGPEWLKRAYDYCRALREERKTNGQEPEDFVTHPEFMAMYGAANFIHKSIGDDHEEFDGKSLCQWNEWPASVFAPTSVLKKFPYFRAGNGFTYEDFTFHVETYGAGVSHRVVPNTIYAVRLKGDQSSMASRYVAQNGAIPRMPFYDRRDVPDAKRAPQNETTTLPLEIHKSILWLHHELGEYLVRLDPEMSIRRYPPHTYFHEQGAIRDAIGDAKHVVLVKELVRGGAENYALNWAKALGKDCVILETEPNQSPWKARAEAAGIRVIQWRPRPDTIERAKMLVAKDAGPQALEDVTQRVLCDAMRRGLIQADLDSLFVCNAPIGWLLAHENAQVLAKKVFAASFAPIPVGHGFTRCPAYFLKNPPPNLVLVTDNKQHFDRLANYDTRFNVKLIAPKVTYDGPSKLSRIEKERMRILWAGRGTIEKGPQYLPPLAAAVEGFADIHVWGHVPPPPQTPENLRFRGPFDGFDKIDGSYDVMLMTSMFEGCPNTAMEAVLADLPIVGPNVGALPQFATMTYSKFDPMTVAMMLKESAGKKNEHAKELVRGWAEKFDGEVTAEVLA